MMWDGMEWNGLIWLWIGAREINNKPPDFLRLGVILHLLND
jgi:hypothetical protein